MEAVLDAGRKLLSESRRLLNELDAMVVDTGALGERKSTTRRP